MMFDVVTGPVAAELAGVSYRQLDHWARQGWVVPSHVEGRSRRYCAADIARLALLRHVGQSGMNVSRLGPQLSDVALDDASWVVVDAEETTVVAGPGADLSALVSMPGLRCVFDAAGFRAQLDAPAAAVPAVHAVAGISAS